VRNAFRTVPPSSRVAVWRHRLRSWYTAGVSSIPTTSSSGMACRRNKAIIQKYDSTSWRGVTGARRQEEIRKVCEAYLFDIRCTPGVFLDRKAFRITPRADPLVEAFREQEMARSGARTCRLELHGWCKERFLAKHDSIDKSHRPLTVRGCNFSFSRALPTNGNHRGSSKRRESSYKGKCQAWSIVTKKHGCDLLRMRLMNFSGSDAGTQHHLGMSNPWRSASINLHME